MEQLRSVADLRTVYRNATGGAVDKVITELDEHCRQFLALSPFMVLSTADANGVVDGSPKGGEPGFVRMLDERRIAWADSAGNNRLDSFENIVVNPAVAVLAMIPGLAETLRINGTAELVTDPQVCAEFRLGAKPARVVVVVTVGEAYLHCSKALKRSTLWQPESWPGVDALPDAMCIFRDHASIPVEADAMRTVYDADAEATLWEPGGE